MKEIIDKKYKIINCSQKKSVQGSDILTQLKIQKEKQ